MPRTEYLITIGKGPDEYFCYKNQGTSRRMVKKIR
jgi:hypothetical protein